jgi:hypothetical protein
LGIDKLDEMWYSIPKTISDPKGVDHGRLKSGVSYAIPAEYLFTASGTEED